MAGNKVSPSILLSLESPNSLVTIFMISSITQGAFLAGGDVIIPDYAAEKYSRVAKLLNWTVLENYHDHWPATTFKNR